MAKSLKKEFVKFYKEKLEPLGFIKVKGSQPYFVRIVNNEILRVITYMETPSIEYGYKAFHLMCGIATVYRKEINFDVSPKHNSDWLVALGTINEKKETEYPMVTLPRNHMIYNYITENMSEVLENTWDGIKVLINEMDKVFDMDGVLWYLLKYNARNVTFRRGLDNSYFDEEGLFFSRKGYEFSKIAKVFERKREELRNSSISELEKREWADSIEAHEHDMKVAKERFVENEEIYQAGMKLLERQYEVNCEKLNEYGIRIEKKDLLFQNNLFF